MRDHLLEFSESVRLAPTDRLAERIVRLMLEDVAKDCPMHVLVHLGQSLVECRKNELREEAERN
jgi:hypothetical protein